MGGAVAAWGSAPEAPGAAEDATDMEAPEGTGECPPFDGSRGFSKPQSLVAAESLVREPCDPRTWFPGPSRGSLLEPVWRFTPAPSGRTKCTAHGLIPTRRLSTNLARHGPNLSPRFPPLWTTCGYTRFGGARWLDGLPD